MKQILHFDSQTKRQIQNTHFLERELNGFDLRSTGRPTNFGTEQGANTLIVDGYFVGYIINTLAPKYRDVLETAILKQMDQGLETHPNIILLGSESTLEGTVDEYGVTVVNTNDGYLQQQHLAAIRAAISGLLHES